MNEEQRLVLRCTLLAAFDLASVFGRHKVASLMQEAVDASDEAALAGVHR